MLANIKAEFPQAWKSLSYMAVFNSLGRPPTHEDAHNLLQELEEKKEEKCV